MERALLAVGTILASCFIGFAVLVYLNREPRRYAVDNLLAEKVTRAVALAEAQTDGRVDMAALTEFRWNRMLLVARRTPPAQISRALGFKFRGDLRYDVESNGMFVFVDGSRMARYADYRGPAVFTGVARPIAEFRPENAVFAVRGLVVRPVRP